MCMRTCERVCASKGITRRGWGKGSCLTFVNPVGHAVVDRAEDAVEGDLIVRGDFGLRPVIDVALEHVDQGVALGRPHCQLQTLRLVPAQ